MTDTREETQLLPCPFCGGEAVAIPSGPPSGAVVRCGDCGARTVSDFQGEAAKRWNTRASTLATEAAPSEPLDDKLVYIKPLRTLVRVQTMYADQVRDLCNAPAAPSEPVAWRTTLQQVLAIAELSRKHPEFGMTAGRAMEEAYELLSPAQPEQADDEPQVIHCPFCNRDPFHRSDSGEAVAVTCCDLGDLLFRGARPEPETVEIAWGDFCKIAEKLVAAKCYAVASQKEVALKNINPAFDELWKNRPWEIHGRSDKDKALGWFTAGVDHALTAQPDTTKSGSEG